MHPKTVMHACPARRLDVAARLKLEAGPKQLVVYQAAQRHVLSPPGCLGVPCMARGVSPRARSLEIASPATLKTTRVQRQLPAYTKQGRHSATLKTTHAFRGSSQHIPSKAATVCAVPSACYLLPCPPQ